MFEANGFYVLLAALVVTNFRLIEKFLQFYLKLCFMVLLKRTTNDILFVFSSSFKPVSTSKHYHFFFLHFNFRNMFVNTESNCTFLKNAFAYSTSNFQSCAIENSRPVTFCENCVQFFIDITKTYSNMEEVIQ